MQDHTTERRAESTGAIAQAATRLEVGDRAARRMLDRPEAYAARALEIYDATANAVFARALLRGFNLSCPLFDAAKRAHEFLIKIGMQPVEVIPELQRERVVFVVWRLVEGRALRWDGRWLCDGIGLADAVAFVLLKHGERFTIRPIRNCMLENPDWDSGFESEDDAARLRLSVNALRAAR
ncbi:MAG: hypothetical protein HS116_19045 [Planctomycetes bacterium]|nr:hypothetical protein [Planctomycetota bacterium]